MYCSKCGQEIDNEAVICPHCGVPTANYQRQSQPEQPQVVINNVNSNVAGGMYGQKSKMVALLLCLFLGGLGVHRFYVGKYGTGVIWLLSGGLVGVGWLIDFILILVGVFKDKHGMPLI